MKSHDELKVLVPSLHLPDPTQVQTTGDLFLLERLSSPLKWKKSGSTYRISLLRTMKFHDGTPITTQDVAWTLKRHLLFPTKHSLSLRKSLLGSNIKSLDQECEGISANKTTIVLRLGKEDPSLASFLASPLMGVWAAKDMKAKTGQMKPTQFSGLYFASKKSKWNLLLKKNPYVPTTANAPSTIRILLKKKESSKATKSVSLNHLQNPGFGAIQSHGISFSRTNRSWKNISSLYGQIGQALLSQKNLQKKKILDAGCGRHGFLVEELRRHRIQAIGVDIAIDPKINSPAFLHADMLKMPFKDQVFDLCLSSFSLPAYASWPQTQLGNDRKVFSGALQELRRVTKIGGYLLLTPMSLKKFSMRKIQGLQLLEKFDFHADNELFHSLVFRRTS